MPPRQGRTPLYEISHRPSHSEVVRVRIHLVVGTYNVEGPPFHLGLEVLNDLAWHPSPRRGLRLVEKHCRRIHARVRGAHAVNEYVRIDPSGHEEVRADPAPVQFPKLVL